MPDHELVCMKSYSPALASPPGCGLVRRLQRVASCTVATAESDLDAYSRRCPLPLRRSGTLMLEPHTFAGHLQAPGEPSEVCWLRHRGSSLGLALLLLMEPGASEARPSPGLVPMPRVLPGTTSLSSS